MSFFRAGCCPCISSTQLDANVNISFPSASTKGCTPDYYQDPDSSDQGVIDESDLNEWTCYTHTYAGLNCNAATVQDHTVDNYTYCQTSTLSTWGSGVYPTIGNRGYYYCGPSPADTSANTEEDYFNVLDKNPWERFWCTTAAGHDAGDLYWKEEYVIWKIGARCVLNWYPAVGATPAYYWIVIEVNYKGKTLQWNTGDLPSTEPRILTDVYNTTYSWNYSLESPSGGDYECFRRLSHNNSDLNYHGFTLNSYPTAKTNFTNGSALAHATQQTVCGWSSSQKVTPAPMGNQVISIGGGGSTWNAPTTNNEYMFFADPTDSLTWTMQVGTGC